MGHECKWCGEKKAIEGGKLCNRCWELSTRIGQDIEIAASMMASYLDGKGGSPPAKDNIERARALLLGALTPLPEFESDFITSRQFLQLRAPESVLVELGVQPGHESEFYQEEFAIQISQIIESLPEEMDRLSQEANLVVADLHSTMERYGDIAIHVRTLDDED